MTHCDNEKGYVMKSPGAVCGPWLVCLLAVFDCLRDEEKEFPGRLIGGEGQH